MNTLHKIMLIAVMAATTSGQAALAGSDIVVDIRGYGGEYNAHTYGNGAVILDGTGDYQDADIVQYGNGTLDIFMSGTRSNLNLTDSSRRGVSKIYTGICPPGGKTRPLDITRSGGTHILRCE
ncbi:MAG: hypothetical protein ACSHWZ_19205 [Sulfitobacter sp.]